MTRRPASPGAARAVNPGRNAAAALSGAVGRACGGAVRACARRPAIVLAGIAVIGGASVFAWNATMTQTGRHPAPLFAGAKVPAAKPEAPKRTEPPAPLTTGATRAEAPMPPPRPSGPDAIGSIIRASEGPVKPPEAKRTAEARPKPVEARPKPAETKVVSSPASAPAKPAPQPRIASAQKALAKLGYGPITADGLLGTTTRLALEKFERDKKLPVTGALGPRTAKQLASLSGISIQ